MNKSLLALLLVCAIAGMAYASPYREVEEQDDDETQQAIQLLRALRDMEEEEVNEQDVGRRANAQWGFVKRLAGSLVKRCVRG